MKREAAVWKQYAIRQDHDADLFGQLKCGHSSLKKSGSGDDAFAGWIFDGFDQSHGGIRPLLLSGFLQCDGAVALQQKTEGCFDFGALIRRETCTFEADDIECGELIVAVNHAVGGNVLTDGRIAL